jgi:alanyl-tRNA synthetase
MVQFKDVFLGAEKRSYVRAPYVAALRACRRQAQRSRPGRLHRAPSHLLRDAGQLQLRRLLQEGRHRLRVGAADPGVGAARRERCWSRSTTPTTKPSKSGTRTSVCHPSASSASATTRGALRFRQFLADGRHRPCGPCTEIFYDHGEHIAGGPPGSPDEDGDRYIEIWNNVFMQFDRQPTARWRRCRRLASTPAWAWSAFRRCCSTCTATTRSTCSRHLIRPPPNLPATADLETSRCA